MHKAMGMGTVAVTMIGVCTSIAAGQARFEAGYRFNDEPEVVRVEPTPFFTQVERDMRAQRTTLVFPFTRTEFGGFADVTVSASRGRDGGDALLTLGWTEVEFSDVVFESSASEPIEVGFRIRFDSAPIAFCCSDVIAGATFRARHDFELAGDSRTGTLTATVVPSGPPDVETTGFLEGGFPPDRQFRFDGFRVPVNTPVTFRVRVQRSIEVPATTDRFQTSYSPASAWDFASEQDVFEVPDGVTVRSGQIGIRDNQRVRCITDLDRDGQLTIFDFLAYQNLFDENDPTADLDFDGELTIFDLLIFQNAFDAGCP